MLRTYGKNAALLTLLGDLLKTAVAIFIAGVLFGFNYYQGLSMGLGFTYVAALFAVIGHVFPIYYKFRGGKGVLSTATALLILSPFVFLILFALFAAIVGASKYVSLGSVVSAVLYPVVLHGYFSVAFGPKSTPGLASLSAIIIAILVVYCHRGNLQRISDRTERKISFKKKTANKESEGTDDEVEN
jgi:glycerol-3-phosphate acyltransferase PlsY